MTRSSAALLFIALVLGAVLPGTYAQTPAAQLLQYLQKNNYTVAAALLQDPKFATLEATVLAGPATALLPTDDAFDRLVHDVTKYVPKFTIATLQGLNTTSGLLAYHLVKGTYKKADLKNNLKLATFADKQNITVNAYNKTVKDHTYTVYHFVDQTKRAVGVKVFDLQFGKNLTVHVIEKYLLPVPLKTFLHSSGYKV